MQNKGEAGTSDQTQEENTCTSIRQDTADIGIPIEGNNQPEIRTSARKMNNHRLQKIPGRVCR